jgi:hypothetical protein
MDAFLDPCSYKLFSAITLILQFTAVIYGAFHIAMNDKIFFLIKNWEACGTTW